MNHLLQLAAHLKTGLSLPVVVEPSRAQSSAHGRLLAGQLTLVDAGQAMGQTDIPYTVNVSVTFSLRLLGGNEDHALMHQGIAYAIRIAELLHEPFALNAEQEPLSTGLMIDGEAIVHNATRGQSGFHRLSEDEQDSEGRLFLFREDWTLTLTTRVLREHGAPTLQSATFIPASGGEPLNVQRNGMDGGDNHGVG